jgi:cation:H+ antiporter
MDIILGLLLLLAGGDTLVRGSVTVARRLGLSELMIGLTLVGFGTSTPELVTSINAALSGSPGISIGNVVGSNIANILFILGLTALIYPVMCQPEALKRDGIALLAATLCCVGLVLYGQLSPLPGVLFIILILSYIAYTYFKERNSSSPSAEMHRDEAKLAEPITGNLWLGLIMAAAGIALTIYGAHLLVGGAIELARHYSISETTIGLTIVAVGTSLPELVTSVVAALRKNSDIALGNVLGSNIYNIWFILGLTAVIHPISVPESIAQLDIWAMLFATVLLVAIAWQWNTISRLSGFVFITLYAVYIGALI